MDALAIIGVIVGVAGVVTGFIQIIQFMRQRREKNASINSEEYELMRWTSVFPKKYPLEKIFLRTGVESTKDLLSRIEKAKVKFVAFGLTRNFFVSDECRKLIERKACEIPITLFLMDPRCKSRKDRYRIEPIEAALEDPKRYIREIILPYNEMLKNLSASRHKSGAGLHIYLYNFPCSFAIEEIDGVCRVMLYGHTKRGTDSPIFVFKAGNPYFEYFTSQLLWLEDLAINGDTEPWRSKGIKVSPLQNPG